MEAHLTSLLNTTRDMARRMNVREDNEPRHSWAEGYYRGARDAYTNIAEDITRILVAMGHAIEDGQGVTQ